MLIDMKLFTELDKDVFQPTPTAVMYTSKSPMSQIIIHMSVTD